VLFELKLPKINEQMDTALIETVHQVEGPQLKMGSKLFDVSIDLSSAFSQNCPPISYYRLVVRENLVLRRLCVSPGDRVAPGGRIALFASSADEPIDGQPAREVRVMTAGINFHDDMWSARAS
jgi:hypothetical protein